MAAAEAVGGAGEGLGESDPVTVMLLLLEGHMVGVGETHAVGLAEGQEEGEGEKDSRGDRVPEAEGSGVGV